MNQTNATNDDDENNFIKSPLNTIDNKFNDEVFTFVADEGCCSTIKTRNSERKKAARDARRSSVKVDVENEDRVVMPTNRERLKGECKEDHTI